MFCARGDYLEDVRAIIAQNTVSESAHEPHDHNELSLRFYRAASLSDEEIVNVSHRRDRAGGNTARKFSVKRRSCPGVGD